MSDSGDRAKRPGGKPGGNRPTDGRPSRGGSAGDRAPRRSGDQRPARRDGDQKPRPEGDQRARRDGDGRPSRDSSVRRDGPPHRSGAPLARGIPDDPDPFGTRSVRNRHDDPVLPDDAQPKELDRVARAQLKTLSKENADDVARHLVMVARLIESDPLLAHQHAVSAARRAGRIAVVRETLAITAYSIGDFALALRELRTYRRISGKVDQLPLMVDSERGLERPDKALELARSVTRSTLPVEVQVLLAIAMSGARLDLGQPEIALTELQIPQLDPDKAFWWSPALFDAYAAVLEELGREEEAEEWWQRSDVASEALNGAPEDDDVVEVYEEGEPGD